MAGFWNTGGERTPVIYAQVKRAGQQDLTAFLSALNNPMAKRGFWEYILDKDDFKRWRPECKKALIREAWFDGFTTLTQYPLAIAATFTATSLALFTLSFVFSTSASLFICVMVTGMMCSASYYADYFTDDYSQTGEKGMTEVGGNTAM